MLCQNVFEELKKYSKENGLDYEVEKSSMLDSYNKSLEDRIKYFKEISEKINKSFEWVEQELNKGPFYDSPIWELMKKEGLI